MEGCPCNFGHFSTLGGNDSNLIVTGCYQLFSIEGPFQNVDFLIETETVVELEAFDVEDFDVEGVGYCKHAALFVAGDL